MPTVTVSDETMEKIEEVQENTEWDITKREIADRGIIEFCNKELEEQ